MTVGQRIKARRQELEMTQEELARKVGVSFQLISRYENNFVDTIPTKKLKLIADALQCTAYELMEGVKAEDNLTAQQLRMISLIKSATPDDVDKIEQIVNLVMR